MEDLNVKLENKKTHEKAKEAPQNPLTKKTGFDYKGTQDLSMDDLI
jgi:hypothetical protein